VEELGLARGQEFFFFLDFHAFESSLVQEFELFQEFRLLGNFCEICKNPQVWDSMTAAWGLTVLTGW